MGILRLLLAVSVVVFHAGFGVGFFDPHVAVKAFFLISGFYMALILNEKYNSYWLFLLNRFMRIFPAYWVVCLASVVLFLIQSRDLVWPAELGFVQRAMLLTANLFLFGQDWIFFFRSNGVGWLELLSLSDSVSSVLPKYLWVAPGWTLSIELTFYVLAPFLARKSIRVLLMIIFCSFFYRCWAYWAGVSYDPWVGRFFPAQLGFFCSGILAYIVYRSIKGRPLPGCIQPLCLFIVYAATFFFQYFPDLKWSYFSVKECVYYFLLFLCIPYVFLYTKSSRLDQRCGDFCYPVYVSHWFVYIFILEVTSWFSGFRVPGIVIASATMIGTVFFSILLLKFTINPIDKFRMRRLNPAVTAP